jgi:chitin synthase
MMYVLFWPFFLWTFSLSHAYSQISWGTKEDTAVETDLGAVIQDSHAEVDVEMFTEAADVNSLYEEALFNLKNRKPLPAKGNGTLSNNEKEQNAKDYYANVRTNVSSRFKKFGEMFG